VYAEWVLVSGNDQTGVAVYLDPDTIRRKGDIVRMLILDDYKTVRTVEGISYFSAKRETLFDCAEERTRLLAFAEFSGNMGNGEVVYGNSDGDRWIPVESDSINKRLWEVACAKK